MVEKDALSNSMIKLAITGPESSGKTTLAKALSDKYEAPWVEEYSRGYLSGLNRRYKEDDLVAIARGQIENESIIARKASSLLICDTDITVIAIWSVVRFNRLDPEIEQMEKAADYDHTLLCRPDIPWEPDPLRENPHDRHELFQLYADRLTSLNRPYTIVEGPAKNRMETAVSIIDNLI